MIVNKKIGHLHSYSIENRIVDTLSIEWFETNKRILHKQSKGGEKIVLKFLNEAPDLGEGDVLWSDDEKIIVVQIEPCEAMVIRPNSMLEMATICYEIGNKHLPLFYNNNELLIPYEGPLFNLLTAAGFTPTIQNRKLINQLKTTVQPHAQSGNKQTLFSKILQLTS